MSNNNKATLTVTVSPDENLDSNTVNLDYDHNGTDIGMTKVLAAALHAMAYEAAQKTGIPEQIIITVLAREIANEAIGYLDEDHGEDS